MEILNRLPSDRSRYLFIYLVRDEQSASSRFCTVLTYGRTQAEAERVAINRVHQQGMRILRTATATAAPGRDRTCDRAYLDELTPHGPARGVSGPAYPASAACRRSALGSTGPPTGKMFGTGRSRSGERSHNN